MGAVLRISGKKLNEDEFNIGWKIKPIAINRMAEFDIIRKKKKLMSQLNFNISNAGYNNLNGSIKDAIKFLKKNQKYLKRILTDRTVSNIAIDFGFNSRIDRKNVEVQNDYLPAELIRLAGSLNMDIWLTQWPPSAK